MASLYPSYKEILRDIPKHPEAELKLIKYLEKNLPDDCTIYVQPEYNYSFPDIIILREHHGVVIIEVNNWNMENYKYHKIIDEKTNGETGFWEYTDNKIDWYKVISPIEQIQKYKNQMLQYYSKDLTYESLVEKNIYAIIRPVVFMCGVTQEQIDAYFNVAEVQLGYVKIITKQDLENGRFLNLLSDGFELLGECTSKYFNKKILDIFHQMLSPSNYNTLKKELRNIAWSKEQLRYIHSQPDVQRKIRGVAGSGKTTVMAARAIDAYKKTHSPVLILTFNITLKRYIIDCISALGGDSRYFVVDHFHHFLYSFLTKNFIQWEEDIDLSKIHIDENLKYFKTIYVDEIQDYEKDWIDFIRHYLPQKGELIFWGDEMQNIYARQLVKDSGENQKNRIYTGIKGRWGKLSESHRFDGKIAHFAELFKSKFMTKYDDSNAIWQYSLHDKDTNVAYKLIEKFDLNILYNLFEKLIYERKIHKDDICILSDKVELLREFAHILNKNNHETITTFETQEQYEGFITAVKNRAPSESTLNIYEVRNNIEDDLNVILNDAKETINLTDDQKNLLKRKIYYQRRSAKTSFEMETGKVKLSTIHSYKGWGIDTEIFIISKDFVKKNDNPDEVIYTAITRAKTNLIIINLENNKYHHFFEKAQKEVNNKGNSSKSKKINTPKKIELSPNVRALLAKINKL